VFSISKSTCLLSVYRKATNFLYSKFWTLQRCCNHLLVSERFCRLLWIFYIIMSSPNKDSSVFSFPICIPCISFSWLIALARTSNMIVKLCGDQDILPWGTRKLQVTLGSFKFLTIKYNVSCRYFFVDSLYQFEKVLFYS